jgi:hypothetical protein
VYKLQAQGYVAKTSQHRRVSGTAAGLKGALRPLKKNDAPFRAKKITRDVAAYWRRAEKEETELRKKAEKDAYQQNKQMEENREAQRQAKKLEFLITQTELYSHFVGKKKGVLCLAGLKYARGFLINTLLLGADAAEAEEEEEEASGNDIPDFDSGIYPSLVFLIQAKLCFFVS